MSRGLDTVYVIHFLCSNFFKSLFCFVFLFFHMLIEHQVFLSNTNNLQTVLGF